MILETVEYKGYEIEIIGDETAQNPMDPNYQDIFGTCMLHHRRYDLMNDTYLSTDDYKSWDEVEVAIIKEYGKIVILPVYMYEHSGVALNTTGFHCQWGSGQVGFIFATYADIRENFGCNNVTKRQISQAEKLLIGEIQTFSYYVNGDVYGYVIKKDDKEVEDGSCWGFYGYDNKKNGLLDSAESLIDYEIKENS